MVESSPPKLVVPFHNGTYVTIQKAIQVTGVPHETIRRWAIAHGIGRKVRENAWSPWKWDISLPALKMRIKRDWAAFQSYCSGDTSSDLVAEYMTRERIQIDG